MDIAKARQLHDDLLASKPGDASHNADICQFCVDKATENTPSTVPDPSRPVGGPDVSETRETPNEHGGRDTTPMSDTISTETHEALVKTKVADAVAATEQALATKTTEAADATARAEKAEADLEKANAEVARLNGELDTAQVNLKAAQDKAAELETEMARKDEASAKEKLATERANQVRNLKVFPDEYVTDEKASSWAEIAEGDWAMRLDEWAAIRPASTDAPNSDAASAMSGTSGELTKDPESDTAAESTKPSPRRAVLGLS